MTCLRANTHRQAHRQAGEEKDEAATVAFGNLVETN